MVSETAEKENYSAFGGCMGVLGGLLVNGLLTKKEAGTLRKFFVGCVHGS
jgi:hypothetical protein